MKPLIITLALAHGADVGTTVYGLKHGAREVFLPTQSPAAIAAIVGGEYAIEVWAVHALSTQGHPKLARVIGWTLVGVRGSIAAHNWRVLRGVQ